MLLEPLRASYPAAMLLAVASSAPSALKPSELSSEYELGQAKVFESRSSRQFVRISIACLNLRVGCFVV